MKKEDIIAQILDNSKIHHNIRIDYSKARKAIDVARLTDEELEGFNKDMWIEGMMIDDFKRDFEDIDCTASFEKVTKLNDNGNRNLGNPKCCLKGEIWQYGRMGATLYWDAYWNGNNSFGFKLDEYDLQEKDIDELKNILNDLQKFNQMVDDLMVGYYRELEYQAKEYKQQCKDEAKQAKYNAMVEPYNVNLFELSKSDNQDIKRIALSLIKLLKIK